MLYLIFKVIKHVPSIVAGNTKLLKVKGNSMLPTFKNGQYILIDSSKKTLSILPKINDVVVIKHPKKYLILVKRVASLGKKTFSVKSDNVLEGQDSRHFGSLEIESLVGIVQ